MLIVDVMIAIMNIPQESHLISFKGEVEGLIRIGEKEVYTEYTGNGEHDTVNIAVGISGYYENSQSIKHGYIKHRR